MEKHHNLRARAIRAEPSMAVLSTKTKLFTQGPGKDDQKEQMHMKYWSLFYFYNVTHTYPQKCLRPLCALIFFSLSKSSRSLLSRALDITWLNLPSLTSFCLFKNQSGILYCLGFWTMVITLSIWSKTYLLLRCYWDTLRICFHYLFRPVYVVDRTTSRR